MGSCTSHNSNRVVGPQQQSNHHQPVTVIPQAIMSSSSSSLHTNEVKASPSSSSSSSSSATSSPSVAVAVAATAPVIPATYRAVQIITPGKLQMVTLPMPVPKANEVLVRVISCGVCHGDAFMVNKWLPGMTLPRVPGHEVIGYAVAVGKDVTRFKIGDKVGRGWHGGHCFQCDNCMDGAHVACVTHQSSGGTSDGGYAEYMIAPFESLARIPDSISANSGGPIMCGGLTVFNALRNSPFKPGNVVAVQGLGGLGHLAVQYARAMGAVTVAISTSDSKQALAKELGAHHYIDTSKQDAVAELKKLGGANIIIATAYDAKAQSALIPGMALNGQMLPVGVDPAVPITIPGMAILGNRASVRGWGAGTAKDAEDTAKFTALIGAKVITETYPFDKFQEAYDRMMTGKAVFRVVLAIAPEAEPAATTAAKTA